MMYRVDKEIGILDQLEQWAPKRLYKAGGNLRPSNHHELLIWSFQSC
jgi:hypothetical protein